MLPMVSTLKVSWRFLMVKKYALGRWALENRAEALADACN
jgi:hypothetical protein